MTRQYYDPTEAERRLADIGLEISRMVLRECDRTIFGAIVFDVRSMILLSRQKSESGDEASTAMAQIESRILSRISFAMLSYAARVEREPAAYEECRQCSKMLRELEKLALETGNPAR